MANVIAPPVDQYRGTNIVPDDDKSMLWEVADFLFGVESIKKIASGKGTWGDALTVGVTAATFFIPPAKLAILSSKVLAKVAVNSEKVIANETASIAAKNAAQRTLNGIQDVRATRSGEYNPVVNTAEDARTLEPNITLGPGATADDLVEYQASQGPAKFMERNPDLDPEDVSILTNKNDIPSVDRSGKAIPNSERAADAKIKRDLNRGTPEEIRTAQKIDELNTKTPREAPVRSAIGAQLDEVILDKDVLEEMLTLSGKEIGRDQVGKVIGVLRRLAQKENNPSIRREIYKDIEDLKKNGMSANIVSRIKSEIKKLDKKTDELQGYIDDPTTSAAKRQTKETVPFFKTDEKTGVTTRDWRSPRSYEGPRPSGKSGKAPDSPARSTLTELKSDEKSITRMIDKETDPAKLSALRSDLKRTQDEIFNQETRQAREAIAKSPIKPEQPKATPELAGAKKEIDKLQKEIDDLRVEYTATKDLDTRKLIIQQARIKGEQIKKLEKRVPATKLEPAANASNITVHSGMATGADTAWAEIADSIGIKTIGHSFKGHRVSGTRPAMETRNELTEEQLKVADKFIEKAAKGLGRPINPDYRNLFRRNYYQVKDSEAVIAIGKVLPDGTKVSGGTGWATQMGIDKGIPVYVFDQVKKSWFKWDGKKFVDSDLPPKFNDFAGIGTRDLNPDGRKAIEEYLQQFMKDKILTDKIKKIEVTTKNPELQKKVKFIQEKNPEGFKKAESQLENLRSDGKIIIAINPESLIAVLKEGKFKNQFETGKSGGVLEGEEKLFVSSNARSATEEKLFKISSDSTDRLIYGFIAPTKGHVLSSFLDQYGKIRVVLKDEVKTRSTFTYSDSLGGDYVPVPMSGKLADGEIFGSLSDNHLERLSKGRGLVNPTGPENRYAEAQIRGQLGIKDIDRIVVDPDTWALLDENIIEELAKRNIKIVVEDKSKHQAIKNKYADEMFPEEEINLSNNPLM